MREDGMMLVRADLCDRLEALRRMCARRNRRGCDNEVAGIKRLAAAYGLGAVVRIADAMEQAELAGERPHALYLDRLQDAIGCVRLDDAAGEAMIASISVRFA
jgi:hypothetical protein